MEIEIKDERIDEILDFPGKVKAHFKKHKTWYIAGGVGLLSAGITAFIMKGRYATLQSGVDGPAKVTVRPFSFNVFAKDAGTIVTTVHNGTRGHPGFRVRNIDHLIDFDTQGQAARAFNISPAMLSSHLNGKIDNVNGLTFERIPQELHS